MLSVGHAARIMEKRNAYSILAGNLEGKRKPLRPGSRYRDNINMDLRKILWSGMD
jgi:hypothetical protein